MSDMRPWTYIASSNHTGDRSSGVFQAGFDPSSAQETFAEDHPDMILEALVPGSHTYVTTFKSKTSHSRIYNLGE